MNKFYWSVTPCVQNTDRCLAYGGNLVEFSKTRVWCIVQILSWNKLNSRLLCSGDILDLFQGEWRCWWRDVIKWRHTCMNDVTLWNYKKNAKSLCFHEIFLMKWNFMMTISILERGVWSFAWSIHEGKFRIVNPVNPVIRFSRKKSSFIEILPE